MREYGADRQHQRLPALIAQTVLLFSIAAARAEDIALPADAGAINVRDVGAKGDGRNDDTAAIQKALDAHADGRAIYLPNGTYLLSEPLHWPAPTAKSSAELVTVLQGQSREQTVLRLARACAGFDDGKHPVAVIGAGDAPAAPRRVAVRALAIVIDPRNPGAIGLQLPKDSRGCIRDVTLRSADGHSAVGLDLASQGPTGPLVVKHMIVRGFDYGVRTAHPVRGTTFEEITLDGQNRFGFVNEGQCVTIRSFTSRNTVPALVNAAGPGMAVLLDANFVGRSGALAKPAILNEAEIFARGVAATGYAETLRNAAGERRPDGRKINLFVSRTPVSLFASPPRSLDLTVKEPPEVAWGDSKTWAAATRHGATPDDSGDDAAGIQAAIDSGAQTVYLPFGRYRIGDTIVLRANVRRLIGCGATLDAAVPGDTPALRVADGASPVVAIEDLDGGAGGVVIDNASQRSLIVRDCDRVAGRMTGRGDVFLENVSSSEAGWRFGRQRVWARQLDVTGKDTAIVNRGGTFWLLGFGAESSGTLVETTDGGKTEVLGGLCVSSAPPPTVPMFVSIDSSLSVVLAEACERGDGYRVLVSETRAGVTRSLERAAVPPRGAGCVLPLYSGFSGR